MNWFGRHLNWTYVLAYLFMLGILLAAEAKGVGGEANLAGLAILPLSGWVITQKGRSLWWILLSGLFSPLWLADKKREIPSNVKESKAKPKFLQSRWFLLLMLIMGLSIVGIGTTLLLASQPKVETALVIRVIDGDTIEIEGGQRLRYIGIDTPEKGEYFFEEATVKNSELVLGKEVRLEKDVSEIDQYGRLLRYVYVGDLFVNAELVRLGYAREARYPPDTKHCGELLRLEIYAADSELGLHNEPKVIKDYRFPTFDELLEGIKPKSSYPSAEEILNEINSATANWENQSSGFKVQTAEEILAGLK